MGDVAAEKESMDQPGHHIPTGSGDMGNEPHLVIRLYLHPTWTLHTSEEKDVASRCTKHNGNGISLTWADLFCLG